GALWTRVSPGHRWRDRGIGRRMRPPALFIGHGSPMNAVTDSAFSRTLQKFGRSLARPRAILCISAHWTTSGAYVLSSPQPKTIHDFNGFPESLYRIRYPAPGDPGLARQVQRLLVPFGARLTEDWG